MDYIQSNVTTTHKLVKVLNYPSISDQGLPKILKNLFSAEKSKQVIVGKEKLFEELENSYRIINGKPPMGDEGMGVRIGFDARYRGKVGRVSIPVLFKWVSDKYIADNGDIFVVFAPYWITYYMDREYPVASIEASPKLEFNLRPQEPLR